MDGRWTVFVCTGCGEATGRHKDCDAKREATPVVPCDEAAIERAGFAICFTPNDIVEGFARGDTDRDYPRLLAEIVLRAAGTEPQ